MRDLASLFPSLILRFHSTFVEYGSLFTIYDCIGLTSMTENTSRFAELLARAINRIHANECAPKTVIRDELGYAAGREGRTAIDYWRRDGGHIPADLASLEGLAREIARRGGLSAAEMTAFLTAACYPDAKRLCSELYPEERCDPDALLSVSSSPQRAFDSKPAIAMHAASAELPNSSQIRLPMPDEAHLETRAVITTPSARPRRPRELISRPWILPLVGLTLLSLLAAAIWSRSSATGLPGNPGHLQLMEVGGSRVQIMTEGGVLRSGDRLPVNTPITVTFRVMNNSVGPVTLRSLVIGVRGPGVTCASDPATRWSALDVPFLPSTNLVLQPGEEYTYQDTRAFYQPGTYFLEPTEQDVNGYWGGIPAFTCFDLVVVE